jgi:large subunit ribosomal protein L21
LSSVCELPIITRLSGGTATEILKWSKDMYAVIETGGKQHRVVEGELLKVEKIEAETGSTIDFDRVLMVGEGESIKVGTPVVDGAKVSAEIVQHGRGDKVTIIKFKRRKHHMKRQGHRQWFTEIKITAING